MYWKIRRFLQITTRLAQYGEIFPKIVSQKLSSHLFEGLFGAVWEELGFNVRSEVVSWSQEQFVVKSRIKITNKTYKTNDITTYKASIWGDEMGGRICYIDWDCFSVLVKP